MSNNQLTSLDLRNGNNTNIYSFTAINNPNLTCISVDDAAWATANWTGSNFQFDNHTNFSDDCASFVLGPTASFSASPTTVCLGDTISFTDTSAGSPTSWNWDFGDGNSSTAQNPTHVYATAGTYDVKLVVSDGSNSDSITKTGYIVVNQLPMVDLGPDLTLSNNILLDAGAGFSNYLWSDGSSNQTLSISSPGLYHVKVTDSNGCFAKDTVLVIRKI